MFTNDARASHRLSKLCAAALIVTIFLVAWVLLIAYVPGILPLPSAAHGFARGFVHAASGGWLDPAGIATR